jgi:ATP-dependent Lon protease
LRDRPEGWNGEEDQLITGYDDKTQLADIAEKLEELKQSLLELDVELEVKLNPNMHDREIRSTTAG